jgi:hypothetical protein
MTSELEKSYNKIKELEGKLAFEKKYWAELKLEPFLAMCHSYMTYEVYAVHSPGSSKMFYYPTESIAKIYATKTDTIQRMKATLSELVNFAEWIYYPPPPAEALADAEAQRDARSK